MVNDQLAYGLALVMVSWRTSGAALLDDLTHSLGLTAPMMRGLSILGGKPYLPTFFPAIQAVAVVDG